MRHRTDTFAVYRSEIKSQHMSSYFSQYIVFLIQSQAASEVFFTRSVGYIVASIMEHKAEADVYIKTHRLDELLGNLTAQLAFNQPGKCHLFTFFRLPKLRR